jgi:hypothetical protein
MPTQELMNLDTLFKGTTEKETPQREKEKEEESPIVGLRDRMYGATVVTLLPRELLEEKPHLLPGVYRIPAAKWGDIEILHVDEGIQYIPNPLIEEGQPGANIKQIIPPPEIARSLVEDYISSHIALGENAAPGLFWVHGKLTKDEVKRFHNRDIRKAETQQINWFRNLIAMADTDWMKNHNMLAVSDLQRLAARCLGVKKDWVEFVMQETVQCPFCTIGIPSHAIVCPNCRQILKQDEFQQRNLGQATA